MGHLERMICTGDIIVFTKAKKLSFMQSVKEKTTTKTLDLPLFALVLYGVPFVLLCKETNTELVPFSHITNPVKTIIRNWKFDTPKMEHLIGEALTGVHATSSFNNSVFSTITHDGVNIEARLVLDIMSILGVEIPIDSSKIDEDFMMSSLLDFSSGFHPISIPG